MSDLPRPLVIWGGTGHARVIRELVQSQGGSIAAVVDNRDIAAPFFDVPILHGLEGLRTWLATQLRAPEEHDFSIAVGGGHGRDRLTLASELLSLGMKPRTLVHASASVALDAVLGGGSQVLMGAAVSACATIGRFAIINTRASVDHDCHVQECAHIAPGATLCGEIQVGRCAFIGAGATILPRLRIGSDAIVGAGAVVTQDVPDGVTVVGCPARVIEQDSPSISAGPSDISWVVRNTR